MAPTLQGHPINVRVMGDQGLLLEFGKEIHPEINERVRRMMLALQAKALLGIVDLIPAYSTLLIRYDPLILPLSLLREHLHQIGQTLDGLPLPEPKLVRIPVVYGGPYGPDLEFVAQYHGLTSEEVVRLHCSRSYLIYMIGFMPGYPYMGELPEALVTPRLKTPRLSVPKGSVAIAQRQTGIYSMESPGGWRILGRTPIELFDPKRDPPALLRMGDRVQFYPISEKEFLSWEG